MTRRPGWPAVLVLLFISLCIAHKTHSSNIGGEEIHNDDNEFFSKTENFVEEYPFQDQPHISPSSSEKDKWITSGNLAYYTMLHATKSVYLPVTVRLIFVGFEGDGNQGLDLDLPNLEGWFEHIEHTFHHTWVSMENRDPQPSVPTTEHTRVEYTINVEVAKVCPLVTTIIEDAILQYIRPEDPDYYSPTATTTLDESDQNTAFYVDAFSFSHVLGSLVAHLGLGTDAYTLFVLNPKRPFMRGEAIYGYRAGFSTKEIRQIHRNESIKAYIESLPKLKPAPESKPLPGEGVDVTMSQSTVSTGKRRTIQFSDFTEQSEVWAQAWLDKSAGGLMVNPACNGDDESQECITAVWESDVIEKIPILELATKMASVDLTAGPLEWGPIIGGEGVRSKTTIPNVPIRPEWRDSTVPLEEEEESPSLAADMERYRSELALLETYRNSYCPTPDETVEPGTRTEVCADVERQIIEMQETISNLESQGSTTYKATLLSGGEYEGANATHVNDDFMSQLGATVSLNNRYNYE